MENIKVVLWGLGSMGSGMAKILVEKKGIEIAGAIANRESKADRDLGKLIGLDRELGVKVTNRPEEAIQKDVDIVLHSTSSFLKDVYPQLEMIIRNKVNVITIAEELAYPAAADKKLSEELDQLAQENSVSVLGTGINPGFILDLLIVTLSGACATVDKIKASRVNDLSPFGPTVMKTQGVGTTAEEFEAGVKDRSIVGHIGFKQSIGMIAERLGWELEEVTETREPIISSTYRETPHIKVEPGMVAGCRHIARGYKNGEEIIVLEHPQQILPEKEGIKTGDYIKIEGVPGINVSNKPEIPGGIGTMAVAINMVPHVIKGRPGMLTMNDLPVPSAIMGDLRKIMGQD